MNKMLWTSSVVAISLLAAACNPGKGADSDAGAVAAAGAGTGASPAQVVSAVPAGRLAVTPRQSADAYYVSAMAAVRTRAGDTAPQPKARNVIIFIGDGMGVSTITASRIYAGQVQGRDGESNSLSMETLPYSAFSKTYSHDTQVADSAATATAMVAGVKTRSRLLGVTSQANYNNCESTLNAGTDTLFELAEAQGMSTGFISTARLTHATPAAAYAEAPNRDWETDKNIEGSCSDIAVQLVDWAAGDGFEVAMAGGRQQFFPAGVADPEYENREGLRTDGRNLVQEWQARGNDRVYVWGRADFDAVNFDSDIRILGLFEPSHMQYELDRAEDTAGEPSLAQLTEAAITRLSRDPDGYVLMVEGGRIDHAHHGVNAARALADTVAFDEAVAMALSMTDPAETLIIVTADHSHTLTLSGYPARGNPILGKVRYETGVDAKAADGMPYTTLGYANGQSACRQVDGEINCDRLDLTDVDTTGKDFLQPALVPLGSETHAGEDVPVYASGPGSELVRGVIEQNEIFIVMGLASGLITAE